MSFNSFLFGSNSDQEDDAIGQVNQLSNQIALLDIPGFRLRRVSSVIEIDVDEVRQAQERVLAHLANVRSVQVR